MAPRFLADGSSVYSKLPLILLLVVLSGCATDVANRYYGGTLKYPPKDSRDVEILWRAPARDYIVIADFQSRGESPEDIREKAARIGADAVIISILGGRYSSAEEWAAVDRYQNTYTRITATAVKYK